MQVQRVDVGTTARLGGGAAGAGALVEIRGAVAVARQSVRFARVAGLAQPALVNGVAGVVSWSPEKQPLSVMVIGFTVRGGKIVEIDALSDPRAPQATRPDQPQRSRLSSSWSPRSSPSSLSDPSSCDHSA